MRRREFLKAGLACGAALGGSALPAWAASHRSPARPGPNERRSVVLIELNGGSDGLNILVPFRDDRYHRARPALHLSGDGLHAISETLACAPPLARLAALHRDGLGTVVQGVGMPVPDRSHFVSLDRWHSGLTGEPGPSGWIGRALRDVDGRDALLGGIALGERSLPRVFWGASAPVPGCEQLDEIVPPDESARALGSDRLAALDDAWGTDEDRALARAARGVLERLQRVRDHAARRGAGIARSPLGTRLASVLGLALSGIHVPAVFIRMRGFDTHARQDATLPQLLGDLDGTLPAFVRALARDGLLERTLVIVYSEFGRRVAENGSRGTDHGAAGPVWIFGGGIPAGIQGADPDLGDLLEGDVRPGCDFRAVLAQALKHLGHPAPEAVLGPEGRPLH